MPATNSSFPVSAQDPDDPTHSHTEFGWLPVIILPLFALILMLLTAAPRLYAWARYGVPLIDDSTSSSSSASTRQHRCEPRDLPHLNAVAPPKTSQALRSELSHEHHAAWAVPAPGMTCVICFDVVKDSDMIRHLACEHTFHAHCIASWYFAEHDTCPICAFHFSSPGSMPQRPAPAHI
ncbi:hypothetical protein DER45DRAFT_551489 [Fusarium avenaceum]|nr:hypothetical protein DER45DRAFT_551489 [Fusarium avenaceum]